MDKKILNNIITNCIEIWKILVFLTIQIPTVVYAQAQFTKLNSTLQSVVSLLQGAGVLVVTIAIIWSGYKMIFQHARWADVSTLVFGAIFIGGAASMASWLIGALS